MFCSEDLSTGAFLITQTICSSCRCACKFGELLLGIIIRVGFVATAVCILRGIYWAGVFVFFFFFFFFWCSVAVVAAPGRCILQRDNIGDRRRVVL